MPATAIRDELLNALRAQTGARILLPSSLSLSGTASELLMDLDAHNVSANMQSDAGAFDAWILALWGWAGVGTVVLKWTPPADPARDGHYQRFLFRLGTLLRLFPERLRLADGMVVQRDAIPFDTVNVCDQDRMQRTRPAEGEAAREWDLVQKDSELGKAFRKPDGLIDLCPQLPVGAFLGSVTKQTAVFTGGKSAVDIVGWDKHGTIHLYELKDDGNAKVGIVSELLFYISMILELRAGRVKPKGRSGNPPGDAVYAQIASCMRVVGTFLAPDFHPLLIPDARTVSDDGARSPMIKMLNEACCKHPGIVPVTFRARRL